jgi:hypothetical protein
MVYELGQFIHISDYGAPGRNMLWGEGGGLPTLLFSDTVPDINNISHPMTKVDVVLSLIQGYYFI